VTYPRYFKAALRPEFFPTVCCNPGNTRRALVQAAIMNPRIGFIHPHVTLHSWSFWTHFGGEAELSVLELWFGLMCGYLHPSLVMIQRSQPESMQDGPKASRYRGCRFLIIVKSDKVEEDVLQDELTYLKTKVDCFRQRVNHP
jgi:hypothetical protein